MYTTLQFIHSYWAYLVLFMVLIATLNALSGFFGNKEYQSKDLRISLFALIVTHIQLVLGFLLYFISPLGFKSISNNGMGAVMKDSLLRLFAVEHITIMILAVVLITVGYSKHKKKQEAKTKFKTVAILYTIALILMLSRIPWQQWFA
ncbi:MAG: hypothetical protein R2786_02530 [Flavobacteriaceae bacterium]